MLGDSPIMTFQPLVVLEDRPMMDFEPLIMQFEPLFVIDGDCDQLNRRRVARRAQPGVSCCTWRWLRAQKLASLR